MDETVTTQPPHYILCLPEGTDITAEGSPLYEIDPDGCYVFLRRATRKEILDLASNILETRIRRSETLENPNEAGGASYSIHTRATTLSKRGLSRSGLGYL